MGYAVNKRTPEQRASAAQIIATHGAAGYRSAAILVGFNEASGMLAVYIATKAQMSPSDPDVADAVGEIRVRAGLGRTPQEH